FSLVHHGARGRHRRSGDAPRCAAPMGHRCRGEGRRGSRAPAAAVEVKAMIRFNRFLPRLAFVVLAAAGYLGGAEAQVTRPLTLEGKRALYQRVIAVPGARVVESAGAPMQLSQPVTPFTVYYVYARRNLNGREWLQVGLDSTGDIRGWMPSEQGVEWRQTLTVGFKDPTKQPRVPLFSNRDALKQLAEQNDVARFDELRQSAISGDVSAGSPVIAVQPEGFIDIRRNFYLVPILSHEDVL